MTQSTGNKTGSRSVAAAQVAHLGIRSFGVILFLASALAQAATVRAFYPFSGDATDASGNGYHAGVSGATLTTDRFGNPNSAYSFDGVNDYIQTPLGSNFKPQAFSVWFKPTLVSGERSIVDSDVSGRYGHSLIIGYALAGTTGDGNLDVQYHNGAYDSGQSMNPGEWYHALVNFSSTIELYLNGSLVMTKPYTGTSYDGSNYRLGRHNSGDPQWFAGTIDDVTFYNGTLTPQEVQQLAGVPLPPAAWLFLTGLALIARAGRGR